MDLYDTTGESIQKQIFRIKSTQKYVLSEGFYIGCELLYDEKSHIIGWWTLSEGECLDIWAAAIEKNGDHQVWSYLPENMDTLHNKSMFPALRKLDKVPYYVLKRLATALESVDDSR